MSETQADNSLHQNDFFSVTGESLAVTGKNLSEAAETALKHEKEALELAKVILQ